MAMKLHNFEVDLKASLEEQGEPYWVDMYSRFFRCPVQLYESQTDGKGQRLGIDRVVILEDGRKFYIEEKVRTAVDVGGKPYTDILLEYKSSEEYNTPGWVLKVLEAHYIAYVNKPANQCYMLPVIELQRAWQQHGSRWLSDYRKIRVPNVGYTTLCVPVPARELLKCMTEAGQLIVDNCQFENFYNSGFFP